MLKLQEEGNGTLSAKRRPIDGTKVLGLDSVESADEGQERDGAVVARFERFDKAATGVGHSASAHYPVAGQCGQGSAVGRIAIRPEHSAKRLKKSLGRAVAAAFIKI